MYFPLKVYIPEPCREDWGKMDLVDINQRHCQSCEKVVTDFTNMSDVQIGNHLRKGGNLCGRFRASQLDRPIAIGGPRRFSGLRAAAAASGLFLSFPAVAQSLPVEPTSHVLTTEKAGVEVGKPNQIQSLKAGSVTITGLVTDGSGEVLIGASVLLKGTTTGSVTDIDGRYSITVSADSTATLIITYTGFTTESVIVSVAELQQALVSAADGMLLTTPLLEMKAVLCEDVVAGGIWYRRSLTHRIFVAPVNRFIVWPIRRLSHDIRDWKEERRAIREERRAERRARNKTRPDTLSSVPQEVIIAELPENLGAENPLQLKASPNPFTDNIKVEFLLPEEQDYTLELLSSAGRPITYLSGKGASGFQQVELLQDIANLPSGTYFLRLKTEKGMLSVTTVVR